MCPRAYDDDDDDYDVTHYMIFEFDDIYNDEDDDDNNIVMINVLCDIYALLLLFVFVRYCIAVFGAHMCTTVHERKRNDDMVCVCAPRVPSLSV